MGGPSFGQADDFRGCGAVLYGSQSGPSLDLRGPGAAVDRAFAAGVPGSTSSSPPVQCVGHGCWSYTFLADWGVQGLELRDRRAVAE